MRILRNLFIGCGVTSCVLIVSCIVIFNYFPQLIFSDAWDMPPARRVQSMSPAKFGQADFLSDTGSFAGQSVYFYVRDRARGDTPIFVGGPYATDGYVEMQRAVWSKDGSVVAVSAKDSQPEQGHLRVYYGEIYVDAYDFRTHKKIADSTSDKKHLFIRSLIAQRGGVGRASLKNPYASHGAALSEEQLKPYPNQHLAGPVSN